MSKCVAVPVPSPSRLKMWTQHPYIPIICSVLCQVWTTLSSWNHFGALDYKDENPLCSLQLITEQWGKQVSPPTVRGSGETTFHANNDGPTVIFPGGTGPRLQMFPLRNSNSGATPFSVWLAMKWSSFNAVKSLFSSTIRIAIHWLVFKRQGIWEIL